MDLVLREMLMPITGHDLFDQNIYQIFFFDTSTLC